MLRTSMTPWQIQMQHHAKKLGPGPLVQINSCCNTEHALIFYLEVWGCKNTPCCHTQQHEYPESLLNTDAIH